MLPLFFQVVLLDSASKSGARLVIPSLATPIGGLISGIIMSRWGKLAYLVRTGALLMFIGNVLVVLLQFNDATWKYVVYVIPANLGQGIVYPGILFSFLAAFDHAGMHFPFRICPRRGIVLRLTFDRSCGFGIDSLSDPVLGHRLGRGHYFGHCAEQAEIGPARGPEWSTRQMESKPPILPCRPR